MLALLPVLAAAASGCQGLIGYQQFEEQAADPMRPGCETGWPYRVPFEIVNASSSELHDYQVPIQVDTSAPIRDSKLLTTADDLRFTTDMHEKPLAHTIEAGLGTTATTIWINVPTIPVGTSRMFMHYGNLQAGASSAGPTFVPDVIANPSFEQIGGWTIEPASGTPAGFYFGDRSWSAEGEGSLLADEEVTGNRTSSARSAISQPVVFPPGSSYVIRFDINIIAASNGGLDGANDGAFAITLGNGINNLWVLGGDRGNITGVRLGEETVPFAAGSVPLTFELRVAPGSGAGYAKGYLDHLRVRKHVSPEPVIALVGDEEDTCSM